MFEYLNDMGFLMQLDKLHMRVQYAKIILLTFADEIPIKEIQGTISSGNLSVNGSSAVRRTINLTMLASAQNSNLEDIDNEISINKKVKVLIGYDNPLKSYKHYGDIVWFPCGLFVLSSANISRSTSGWNISITGKDKMCLLDGSAGGTLPASVTFHESLVMLDNGDMEIQYPTIYQIIYEAVNHWGGEAIENIVISDIDEEVKMLVKWMGDTPVYFNEDYSSVRFDDNDQFPHMFIYGQDVGYQMTSFTYPGELVLNAGDTVVTLLDKIVGTLGNYEYFYNVDGKFIFQEIKNYLNTGSPILELSAEDYVKSYNNAKFLYSLTDLDTTTAITRNPKYDNVKNDFYVWGSRTTASGVEVAIRYHLAIDDKPDIELAGKYMWEIKNEESNLIIRYEFTDQKIQPNSEGTITLIGIPCDEWREELYRRALDAQVTNSVYDNYYDSELIAEWRGLYDPMNLNWDATNHWNPDVFNDPRNINYWLDFIDTGSEIGKYSISAVGRRSIVKNSDDITTLFSLEVPDVIFLTEEEWQDVDRREYYNSIGQKYFKLQSQYNSLFATSSSGATAFEKIRELLYQHLSFNASVSLTCFPKYYLEPNNIIYIEDVETGIIGNYSITQFTLPLTYNGVMNIQATEVLTRV